MVKKSMFVIQITFVDSFLNTARLLNIQVWAIISSEEGSHNEGEDSVQLTFLYSLV